jgi:hypothetical protein
MDDLKLSLYDATRHYTFNPMTLSLLENNIANTKCIHFADYVNFMAKAPNTNITLYNI